MRLALLLVTMTACSAPTEIMLIVKAGSGLTVGVGADIDTLRVRAQPQASSTTGAFFYEKDITLCTASGDTDCRPERYASTTYDGALTLPVHLLFAPGSEDADADVRIWVDGLASGTPRLSNGLVTHFAKGHRLWLELPLYPQCLGKLDCQALDEACDVDTRCVVLVPTKAASDGGDVVPSDGGVGDFGVAPDASVLLDASAVPDLAPVCGSIHAPCCVNGGDPPSCNTGSYCLASGMICAPCGALGQTCCPTSGCTAGTCNGNDTCECGFAGEMCCEMVPHCSQAAGASVCNTSQSCVQCGSVGLPCCDLAETGSQCPMSGTCTGMGCQ